MRKYLFGTALLALATCLVISFALRNAARAQVPPPVAQAPTSLAPSRAALAQAPAEQRTPTAEAAIKARMNQWTVGLAAGLPDGGFRGFSKQNGRTAGG